MDGPYRVLVMPWQISNCCHDKIMKNIERKHVSNPDDTQKSRAVVGSKKLVCSHKI